MDKKIIAFVKYNKFFLKCYRFFGNIIIFFLKCFIKVNKKRILFVAFGGKKYDDSPKALYEKMKADNYFSNYEFIWAFQDPKNYPMVNCRKIKIDTLRYYKAVLSSRIWITNSSVERGLKCKRKKNIEIHVGHGTPLKKLGSDIQNSVGYAYKIKVKEPILLCAQSDYDKNIWNRIFNTGTENILLSDLPRNDTLFSYSGQDIKKIKQKLNIPESKQIILYAPTFREYDRDALNSCYINPPLNLDKWKERLGEKYILLFRAHYEVIKVLGIEDNDFVRDVSAYPCLNDLIVVSNLLISDYSSIYFDYAITEKPMFNFSYDLETYNQKRGLYLDLEKTLPCNVNKEEESLLNEIMNFDKIKYREKTKDFKKRFAPNAGHACDIVINKIKEML